MTGLKIGQFFSGVFSYTLPWLIWVHPSVYGGVDGVKDGKLFKKLHKLRFLEIPGAKSGLSTKISKFCSTVSCIRVLRAIMPNLNKVGLILSKGENRSCPVRIFGNPTIWLLSPLPSAVGYEGFLKITLNKSPFSLVYKDENCMALSFLVLEKLKFFCGKTAFSLSFPL